MNDLRAKKDLAELDVKTLQGHLEESNANDVQEYEMEIDEAREQLRKKEMEIEELN